MIDEGTTTASSSGGSPEAYVSRYALRAADIERGDRIHWQWDEDSQQLIGELVSEGGDGR
jgi:hypothetical protein